MRHTAQLLGLAALLLAGGVGVQAALPEHRRQPDTWGSQQVFEDAPATSLIGGFRTTTASWLFARAQEYLHGGVMLRAATTQEQETGAPLATHGDELESNHGAETGVIPPPGRDPRWVWGMLERETQPYMDVRSHRHHDLREALPLYRMMTWSDPYFVEAYSQGAYMVFSGAESQNLQRALDFLKEGLHYNPRSWQLHKDYAHYHLYNVRDWRIAREYYLKAIKLTEGLPEDKVSESELEAAWIGLVQALRKLDNRDEALQWAALGMQRDPAAPTFRRIFEHYGVPVPKLRNLKARQSH